MFALVAMFLLPATVVVDSPRDARRIGVDYAKVSHPKELRAANREDALLVAITRDGQVWFDADRISPENLPAAIRQRVRRGAEQKVYIRADMRAKYGLVVMVLDNVRAAGIEQVAFIVGERNLSPTS
jgi:biopolymer transport protein ExbD/biopolymer transport protein TolR